MAIIYLGDSKENISPLTKARALASIPVGGSYRIIDFALSNVVNAGIRNVGLFCGNEELNSLTDHIGMGAEWDLARKKDGIFIFKRMLDDDLSLNQSRISKNMEYFFRSTQDHIVALNGHMVCNLDISDLIEKHNGEVPENREALESLAGVGRKTANVVLNTAFGHPTIAVDTHIFRVCNRTNFAPGKDVVKVEEKLLKVVPDEFKVDVHHWLILHGRYTCIARKPRCGSCIIEDLCEYKEKIEF